MAGFGIHPTDPHTADRIAALEAKWAALDVRLKILENLDAQADTDEFAYFWKQYPRKVGKGQARKAFKTACKKVSFDRIMDGLAKYRREKPDKIDWKHPATWLNSEGWEDNWTDIEAPGEPEKVDPDKATRTKLTEIMGDLQKSAMLYNYFMNVKDRPRLFELAFQSDAHCRASVNLAVEQLGYSPIAWGE